MLLLTGDDVIDLQIFLPSAVDASIFISTSSGFPGVSVVVIVPIISVVFVTAPTLSAFREFLSAPITGFSIVKGIPLHHLAASHIQHYSLFYILAERLY